MKSTRDEFKNFAVNLRNFLDESFANDSQPQMESRRAKQEELEHTEFSMKFRKFCTEENALEECSATEQPL